MRPSQPSNTLTQSSWTRRRSTLSHDVWPNHAHHGSMPCMPCHVLHARSPSQRYMGRRFSQVERSRHFCRWIRSSDTMILLKTVEILLNKYKRGDRHQGRGHWRGGWHSSSWQLWQLCPSYCPLETEQSAASSEQIATPRRRRWNQEEQSASSCRPFWTPSPNIDRVCFPHETCRMVTRQDQ